MSDALDGAAQRTAARRQGDRVWVEVTRLAPDPAKPPAVGSAVEATSLERVEELASLAFMVEARLRDYVVEARHDGDSWQAIALALRTTREEAQRRYGRAVGGT